MTDDPMGGSPNARSSRDLVLEVQQAKVLGALFARPVLQRFGRYVVLDVLGQGGMGVVLKGYDDELDRQVAIKVLHEELGEQHTARLRREAQAMAKLSHPNVVQVYEVGQLEGRTFVAMELVKGQTVRQWLAQEPRPGWRACVEVFLQLGQGLAAAHGAPDEDNVVCGVEHGPDGHLYGVNYRSELLTLDPVTGEAFERRALAGVEIESCAMAFDCREGRLLLANGRDRTIYEVDVAAATVVTVVELSAQLPGPWFPTGLEHDPVTGWAWLSTGPELHYVELADGGQAWTVGSFVEPVTQEGADVSNLQYLPACR